MKRTLPIWITIALISVTLSSCSLLKLSVSTGDPLSEQNTNIRIMTRAFYNEITQEIIITADSIIALTPEIRYKIGAIHWKTTATKAAVNAAMQSIPEVAMADLWILSQKMNSSIEDIPDSLLFGEHTILARQTTKTIQDRVELLAKNILSNERYLLMETFVDDYLAENEGVSYEDLTSNTAYAWLNYLKENGIIEQYQTGDIAEVISDLGDKVDGQAKQISKSVFWTKDIIELQLGQDSLKSKLESQLEQMEKDFKRVVVVMEHIPEIADAVLDNLNTQVSVMMSTFNRTIDSSLDNAFLDIDKQREEVQNFISLEREKLVEESENAVNKIIDKIMNDIPDVIGEIVLYIIILVLVLLGVPFVIGFWLGGVRQKIKRQK